MKADCVSGLCRSEMNNQGRSRRIICAQQVILKAGDTGSFGWVGPFRRNNHRAEFM